jgi:hypothetical protein
LAASPLGAVQFNVVPKPVVLEVARPVGALGTAVHVPPPLLLLPLPHAGIRTRAARSMRTSSEPNLIRQLFPAVRRCKAQHFLYRCIWVPGLNAL